MVKKTLTRALCCLLLSTSLNGFSQTIKFTELTNERTDRQDFKTYISKDGATYNVGDTIHILSPSQVNGEFASINGRIDGDMSFTNIPASSYFENKNIIVENIFATSGNALNPSTVIFHFAEKSKYGGAAVLYYIDIEKAIKLGEVKSFGMTSDEALAELKKAKDKLDLGIINQKEYDKIRADLVKYIKK